MGNVFYNTKDKKEKSMKRKAVLLLAILGMICFWNIANGNTLFNIGSSGSNIRYSCAQGQDVTYSYDSLGRVSAAIYPDGTKMIYEYDANGNLLSCTKAKEVLPPEGGGQSGGNQSGGGTTGGNQQSGGDTGNGNSSEHPIPEQPAASNPLRYSKTDIKNYNKFKKKKPVIKSLKKSSSKKKYYLKIQIRQINKRGIYGENGYQIKHATNSKFKKAKTIKLSRNKKSSITKKSWKVKKGKTYYVKVRGYMKTRTGKVIYSKYSKVKKLKVK